MLAGMQHRQTAHLAEIGRDRMPSGSATFTRADADDTGNVRERGVDHTNACDAESNGGYNMSAKTTDTNVNVSADADATLEAWLAEVETIASDSTLTRSVASAHVAGNLDAMAADFVRSFVESNEETTSLDADAIIGWTKSRKGRDADQASVNEAYASIRSFVSTFTHPLVVNKSDDAITLTNPLAGNDARDAAMREVTRLRVLVNANRAMAADEKKTAHERKAAGQRANKHESTLRDFVTKLQQMAARDR